MSKIGIFFGTDTGTTRLIAKKITRALGPDIADKPVNVNRTNIVEMLAYDALILGTPTYGEGELPGIATGVKHGSWQEFLPQLEAVDLSGKTIALYGLGDQEKYPNRFANALGQLHAVLAKHGATLIGEWASDGYEFKHSSAVQNGKFVGLVIDHGYQGMLTDKRIQTWLEQIRPDLLKAVD